MATRNVVPIGDGCPWCGDSAEEMMEASGLGFDQALEAHVQECELAQAEMGSN